MENTKITIERLELKPIKLEDAEDLFKITSNKPNSVTKIRVPSYDSIIRNQQKINQRNNQISMENDQKPLIIQSKKDF